MMNHWSTTQKQNIGGTHPTNSTSVKIVCRWRSSPEEALCGPGMQLCMRQGDPGGRTTGVRTQGEIFLAGEGIFTGSRQKAGAYGISFAFESTLTERFVMI